MTMVQSMRRSGFAANSTARGRWMELVPGGRIKCLMEDLVLAELPPELTEDSRETSAATTMDDCEAVVRGHELYDPETDQRWTITRKERSTTLPGATKLFLVVIEPLKDDLDE